LFLTQIISFKALIQEQWVLTAAHCVIDKQASTIDVLVDRYDLLSTASGTFVTATQLIVYPTYSTVSKADDIALIKLSTKVVETSYVKYSALENLNYAVGTQVWVSGWVC